jgi:hypothetical protein
MSSLIAVGFKDEFTADTVLLELRSCTIPERVK